MISEIKANYFEQNTALKDIQRVLDRKERLKMQDFKYIKSTVNIVEEKSIIMKKSDIYNATIVAYYELPTNEIGERDGKQIVTTGEDVFDYTISQEHGKYLILSKEKHPDFPTNFESNEQYMDPNISKEENLFNENTRGSYLSTLAVYFAYSYYLTPPPTSSYFDYTSYGGDCTNFLSHCLKSGGWTQTSYWHWSNNGTSCSTMSCPRSPAWTGAYPFYQYITGVGSARVISQFADLVIPSSSSTSAFITSFKNTTYWLNPGDIIQIASTTNKSTIGHSTIVTNKTLSSLKVLITCRTATWYNVAKDKYIGDFQAGLYLQGFKVKATF